MTRLYPPATPNLLPYQHHPYPLRLLTRALLVCSPWRCHCAMTPVGRIPTNEEGFTVDGRSVLPGPGAAPASSRGPVLVFVSHRWLRPASYEPDDAAGTKAKV